MFFLKRDMRAVKPSHILFLALIVLAVFISSSGEAIYYFEKFISNDFIGTVAFISLFALVTIIAPLTALPLVSPASVIFGPALTGLYSIAGWTLGAAIAFLIARYLGKPVLSLFISLKRVEQFEMHFSDKAAFLGLIMLRMVMPVDLLSYAVGLLSRMSFTTYILATVIGITPFAFIFSYAGSALVMRQYTTLFLLSLGSFIIFGIIFYLYRIYIRNIKGKTEDKK